VKQSFSIDRTELGIVMDFNDEHSRKHSKSRILAAFGRMMDNDILHFSKQ
jgi:hypothetical protein